MRIETFEIKDVLKRVVNELNAKIHKITDSKHIDKKDFWAKTETYEMNFPIRKDTYYAYTAFIGKKKAKKKFQSMDLRTFFDVCLYTDVSADYLLGFNTSKRKEDSAEKVRQEFGLSDKSMETLSLIKKNKPEVKGELSSDIVNIILENQNFWRKLNDCLPVYLSNINYSRADIDVDVARYALNRVFEELIDDICDKLQSDKLPYEELDNTGVFGQ